MFASPIGVAAAYVANKAKKAIKTVSHPVDQVENAAEKRRHDDFEEKRKKILNHQKQIADKYHLPRRSEEPAEERQNLAETTTSSAVRKFMLLGQKMLQKKIRSSPT